MSSPTINRIATLRSSQSAYSLSRLTLYSWSCSLSSVAIYYVVLSYCKMSKRMETYCPSFGQICHRYLVCIYLVIHFTKACNIEVECLNVCILRLSKSANTLRCIPPSKIWEITNVGNCIVFLEFDFITIANVSWSIDSLRRKSNTYSRVLSDLYTDE